MREAARLAGLGEYFFAGLEKRLARAREEGRDVISLAVGDPDLPAPEPVVEALRQAVSDPATHRYPSYWGSEAFRKEVAAWMERRFGVSLDHEAEVMALIGSKEGIAHLSLAVLDPGSYALVPDPSYPVYRAGALLAGGEVFHLALREEDGFLPRFGEIPRQVLEKARVLWLCYPNNPTAAVAELGFFEEAVAFCRRFGILLAHDAAYSEITFDGFVAPSVLQVRGARDVAIEFHSFSKTCNMAGWRLGWACGSRWALEALAKVKTNVDSGVFEAVARAGAAGLRAGLPHLRDLVSRYQSRRDLVVGTLTSLGLKVAKPMGSLYVWVRVPEGETGESFAGRLLEKAGVLVAPGEGYGESGKGYFRISLTVPDPRLEEAMARLRAALG